MAIGTNDSLKKLSNFSKCGGEWDQNLQKEARIDRAISQMKRISELTGLSMFCFDSINGIVLDRTNSQSLPFLPSDVLDEIEKANGLTLIESANGIIHFVFPIVDEKNQKISIAGFVFSKEKQKLTEIVLAAVEREWTSDDLDSWLEKQRILDIKSLHALLSLALLHL
ncbi:hypothetical protein, partial [uncultured Gimesia sp.]|uniref:hypothetical protein n=1 Tax=uncultured Gimesia sp. TaxID=1678688 RepID=UPI00261C2FE8